MYEMHLHHFIPIQPNLWLKTDPNNYAGNEGYEIC